MRGKLETIYDITIPADECATVHLVNRGSQSNPNIKRGIVNGIQRVGTYGGHSGGIVDGGFEVTTFGHPFIPCVHSQFIGAAVTAVNEARAATRDAIRLMYCSLYRTKSDGATWAVRAGHRVWALSAVEVA